MLVNIFICYLYSSILVIAVLNAPHWYRRKQIENVFLFFIQCSTEE